jgi:hypothetical protein
LEGVAGDRRGHRDVEAIDAGSQTTPSVRTVLGSCREPTSGLEPLT